MTNPPRVAVRTGQSFKLGVNDSPTDADLEAATTRIMAEIVAMLPDEARVQREPTPEELARTYPSSYKGDPTAEANRRPGTD